MRRLALSLAAALGLLAAGSACSSSTPGPEASSDDIIGGVDAKGAKLNAIGTVGRKGFDGAFDYFCTATLVAPNVVLTAKHCATRDPKSGRTMLDEDDAAAVDGLPSGSALLVVRRGPGAGSRFLLDQDLVTAGRHPESEIFLDDITVSRRHVEFARSGDGYTVTDVGSLNGTYVNRARVYPGQKKQLFPNDVVQIGTVHLKVVLS